MNLSKISLDDSQQNAALGTAYANMVFGPNVKVALFSSVCKSAEYEKVYVEVPPNKDKLLYDEANEYIK